jgi:hypothetical protein
VSREISADISERRRDVPLIFEQEKTRRSRPSNDYLVLWRPRGGLNQEVLGEMRVIEAFSSSLPLAQVRNEFELRDKRPLGKLHGEGIAFVVEQGPGFWL